MKYHLPIPLWQSLQWRINWGTERRRLVGKRGVYVGRTPASILSNHYDHGTVDRLREIAKMAGSAPHLRVIAPRRRLRASHSACYCVQRQIGESWRPLCP